MTNNALGDKKAMMKLCLTLLALAAISVAPFVAKAQDTQTTDPVLKGQVTRPGTSANQTPIPVSDAVVELFTVSGDGPLRAVSPALATTVSDDDGNYELVLGTLNPTETYAVKARGEGDFWTEITLGTGADAKQWLKPTDISVGHSLSQRDEIAEEQRRIQLDYFHLQNEEAQRRQRDEQLRRQLDTMQSLRFPPTPPGPIQQVQSEIQSNAAAWDKARADLQRASQYLQALQAAQQNQANADSQTGYGTKRVLFATDRAINQKPKGGVEITDLQNADGKVRLGVCEVAVRRQGESADNLMRLLNDRDSERYYSILNVDSATDSAWWNEAKSALKTAHNNDALLFIHGYNVSFDDACRRAAQIAYDIKFVGPVLLYSWPSRHRFLAYGDDEVSAAWTTAHFVEFLKQILDQKELGHLHIIAHSMGNRVLTEGLASGKISQKERVHLGEIVMAAPDLDRKTFHQQYNLLAVKAMRITLYASNRDQALLASKIFHGFVRLGEISPDIEIKAGMDSIDASAVDTGLIGHSYIGDSMSILDDVSPLIVSYAAPDQRHSDLARGQTPNNWWIIHP